MTDGLLDYPDALDAVHQGIYIAVAAGTFDDTPAVAWVAAMLDPMSVMYAVHPDPLVRAAQAVGAVSKIRAEARGRGFIPA